MWCSVMWCVLLRAGARGLGGEALGSRARAGLPARGLSCGVAEAEIRLARRCVSGPTPGRDSKSPAMRAAMELLSASGSLGVAGQLPADLGVAERLAGGLVDRHAAVEAIHVAE